MLILCPLVCHSILNRECMCETMNSGPFLIIRNTFPTILSIFYIQPFLNQKIQKTLLLIAYTYKTPKISSIIVSTILAYLFTTMAYLLIVLHLFYFDIILTTCAWQPLGEVEGTKQFTLFGGSQGKDKKINHSLLIPREFDIKPSSHPSWGNRVSYTIHYALGVST